MSGWIEVKNQLPVCNIELEDDPDEDGYARFHGYASQSVEITNGYEWARGHYRDDGKWTVYEAEYEFLMIDPKTITHWQPMIELPALKD